MRPTAMRRQSSPQSTKELLLRANALAGATVGQLARCLNVHVPISNVQAKGLVGTLLEAALGADLQAKSRPDFPTLGVELKSIPVDERGHVLESTFVCSIYLADADTVTWPRSRLRQKLDCVLFVPLVGDRAVHLSERRFAPAVLWRANPEQENVLRSDWELLMGHIGAGQIDRLHGLWGEVLQLRPKAKNNRQRTWAMDEIGPIRALPLGFYLRPAFTGSILAAARAVRCGSRLPKQTLLSGSW